MNEGYIKKLQPDNELSKGKKSAQTISFEAIAGTDKLRLTMCDGVNHWFEEEEVTEGVTGGLDLSIDKLDGKFKCDCPDKDNRKDAFGLFK